MNLILLEDKDFITPDNALITGRRFEHLINVNRIKQGDTLICGKINDRIGQGFVSEITDVSCSMEVTFNQDPPAPIPLILVLALPRPKMLRRIIQAVTSMGVKQIYLINSWRVEKSFWQSPFLEPENLRDQMILGLEQARDTLMPQIHLKRFFKDFIQNDFPRINADSTSIVAHPKTGNICPCSVENEITLVIGPEGGFIDYEIQSFKEHGAKICHIGSRILRVETAVPYLISRLVSNVV